MEILLNKKTTDTDLKEGMQVCYKDQNGVYSKLGIVTDIIPVDDVNHYLINTSMGSYHADELKLVKQLPVLD